MSRMVEGSIILKKWEGLDVEGRWLSQLALTLLRRVLALGAICFSVKKCLVCVDESQRLNVCIVSISSTLVVDFIFCVPSLYMIPTWLATCHLSSLKCLFGGDIEEYASAAVLGRCKQDLNPCWTRPVDISV